MPRNREEIFEIIVREHEFALLAFVRSCVHDRGVAEDLMQETFLVAWKRLDEYDENKPFARWLRGIAKNKILTHGRDSATALRHVRILDPEKLTAVAEEFDVLVPHRGDTTGETLEALEKCLSALPAADDDVVRRSYHRGQSCRVIAGELGKSVEAIKKRLQRIRVELRDCILAKLKTGTAHG